MAKQINRFTLFSCFQLETVVFEKREEEISSYSTCLYIEMIQFNTI